MWVRKSTGPFISDVGTIVTPFTSGTAYSQPIRSLGAKCISVRLLGTCGTALTGSSVIVESSNVDSPSLFGGHTDWVTTTVGGLYTSPIDTAITGLVFSDSASGFLVSIYPGSRSTGVPTVAAGSTTAIGPSCILCKWVRIKFINGAVTIGNPAYEAHTFFEGEDFPRVVTGFGYTTKMVPLTLTGCYSTKDYTYLTTDAGQTALLGLGSEVAYADGLPVTSNGKLYVGQVINNNSFRLANPYVMGGEDFLLMPKSFSGVTLKVANRTLVPDPNTL